MTNADASAGGPVLEPAPRLRHIEIVANEHSGSVGVGAAAQAEAIARARLRRHGQGRRAA